MPYRLAIFDLDGTLTDSFRWFLCVVNDVADRFKFKRIEAHEVEALRGLSARDIVRHLEVPAWLIARHMRILAARDLDKLRLFEGVEQMLCALSAEGVQIAIVSSNSESNVRSLLGPELAARVDYYACGASLFGKARKIRQTLRALGVPRPHAILIGDEIRDYEAAHRAGVAFGAVGWGYTSPEALRALGASALFMEPREILNRLVPAIERKAH
jgi:phosphoglycolate phosphatase